MQTLDLGGWLFATIVSLGVVGVFISVFIESIFSPVPASVIIIFAGGVFVPAHASTTLALWNLLWMIAIPASLGGLLGNYLIYALTYREGKPVINRFENLTGVSWDDITHFKDRLALHHKGAIFLIVLRAVPIVPLSVVSAAYGAIKTNWREFGFYTFIGLIIRNFLLGFIGWKVGQLYLSWTKDVEVLAILVFITFAALIGFVYWLRKNRIIHHIIERISR
jgi:membrane protein DedA with SNARE-associated domain